MLASRLISRISSNLSKGIARSVLSTASRASAYGFSNVTTWSTTRDYAPANKKYLQPWEVERKEYVDLSLAIQSVYSCKMLGEILKDNLQILTDY